MLRKNKSRGGKAKRPELNEILERVLASPRLMKQVKLRLVKEGNDLFSPKEVRR